MGRASSTTMQCRCSSSFDPGQQSYSKVAKEIHHCFSLHLYHIPGCKPCSCSFFALDFTRGGKWKSSCNILGRSCFTVALKSKYLCEMAEPIYCCSGSRQMKFSQDLADVSSWNHQPSGCGTGGALMGFPRNSLTSTGKQTAGLTSWESHCLHHLACNQCHQVLTRSKLKNPSCVQQRSLSDLSLCFAPTLLPGFSGFCQAAAMSCICVSYALKLLKWFQWSRIESGELKTE